MALVIRQHEYFVQYSVCQMLMVATVAATCTL